MKIIITAESAYWNLNHPGLKEHMDNIIVIKLREYDSVSQLGYKVLSTGYDEHVLGQDDRTYAGLMYKALVDSSDELVEMIANDSDVVLLCDNNPESILPYKVLKERIPQINVHVFAISPFKFEGKRRNKDYKDNMLAVDESKSFIDIDVNRVFDTIVDEEIGLLEFFNMMSNYAIDYLNSEYLNDILEFNENENYYFDQNAGSFKSVMGLVARSNGNNESC